GSSLRRYRSWSSSAGGATRRWPIMLIWTIAAAAHWTGCPRRFAKWMALLILERPIYPAAKWGPTDWCSQAQKPTEAFIPLPTNIIRRQRHWSEPRKEGVSQGALRCSPDATI